MLMNKILRLSFVAVLAMVSALGMAQTTITFDPATVKGANSEKAGPGKVTKDGVTLTLDNGMLGAYNQKTKFYEYRIYKGNTLTVSSTVGAITKVVFTCTAEGTDKQGPGNFTLTEGSTGDYTYEGKVGTWTGSATQFGLVASTNQVRATSVEVTIDNSGTAVTAPVISGEETFYDATTVTITAGEGAAVYYTTDGTTPTDKSTAYTAPFKLTETATVNAIAVKDGKTSDVATKTFTKKEKLVLEGDGTEAKPYSVKDALTILGAGQQTKDSVYVRGVVTDDAKYDSKHHDCNFHLLDATSRTDTIYAYGIKDLGGAAFADGSKLVKGTVVVVKSVLTVYKSTNELNRGSVASYEGTDGISAVKSADRKANTPAYNLSGQRVSAGYKGIVVKNGKKYLMR